MAGHAHLKKKDEKYHYLVSQLKSCQLNIDVISKQKLYGVIIKIITNCYNEQCYKDKDVVVYFYLVENFPFKTTKAKDE